MQEDVRFMLPKVIRPDRPAGGAQTRRAERRRRLRTLIISDLHLGAHTEVDVLRRAESS